MSMSEFAVCPVIKPANVETWLNFRMHVALLMFKGKVSIPRAVVGLGIGGECGELFEADHAMRPAEVLKEAGDVLWYLQALCNIESFDLACLPFGPWEASPACALAVNGAKLVDMIKKLEWHGKPQERFAYRQAIGNVLFPVREALMSYGFTIEQAMEANIEKLKARYPAGFSEGGGIRE